MNAPDDDPENEEGVLVDSGGFRVDRRRALDKLMRFQLPDPAMFTLPLVRAAVASGASYVRLGQEGNLFELRFDGLPLGRGELSDPYSCLFDRKTEGNARNRELAIAVLSALRLSPRLVTVVSGKGHERLRLRVESLEKDSIEPSLDPGEDTVLKIALAPTLLGGAPDLTARVRQRCKVSPIPIWIGTEELPRSRRSEELPGLYFEDGPVHGWIGVPSAPAPQSSLHAYTLGVFVAETHFALPLVQVQGYLNDDQWTLNASQTGIARNARFRKTMDLLASQAERLLLDTIGQAEDRLGEAGRLVLEPELLYYWKDRLERGSAAESPNLLQATRQALSAALASLSSKRSSREFDETVRRLRWCARATAWLRDAAWRLLAGGAADAKKEPLRSLWSAPLYLTSSGRAVSLANLDEQRRRLGYIPITREPFPHLELPFEAVWLASERDLDCLAEVFSGGIREVTDVLRSMKERGGGAAPVKTGATNAIGLCSSTRVPSRIWLSLYLS